MQKTYVTSLIMSLLLVSAPVFAATVVTVDDDKVTVNQGQDSPQTVVINQAPMLLANEVGTGIIEGRVVEVNYSSSTIVIEDANGNTKQVSVKPDMINTYRIGDYVQIRAAADLMVVTPQENPKDFEGEIIRVEMSEGQIVVLDTNGRERRVQLKQGMIATYKVDDYVRVHLMADLKEAKTIETIRGMRHFEGSIVSVDNSRSLIVLRDTHGVETPVIVRQGTISGYKTGDQARVYLRENHDDVQVIHIIR